MVSSDPPSGRNSLRNAFAPAEDAVSLPEWNERTSSVQVSPFVNTDEDAFERRRHALNSIDNAHFGWRHIRAIIVAGVGFFTDAYDIFAINLAIGMIGIVYFSGKIPTSVDTAIKVSTSGGTVVGQLFFGWLADRIGRKRMYGFELIIMILATLAQALSSGSPSISTTGLLVFWRVIMGIGIGGDYPLSSVITSEFATTKWRGAMMGAVFAMQGLGQFAAAMVALIVTAGFKETLLNASDAGHCTGECALAVDKMWRVVIGIGCVPAVFALYFRLTIPETPRFTFDVTRDHIKAESDVGAYLKGRSGFPIATTRGNTVMSSEKDDSRLPKASWSDFRRHYSQWKHGKVLLGTAASWFFLDVAFYGLGLNNSIILKAIGWTGGSNLYEVFYRNAVGNLILICAGAIPGYWVTVATVDTLGRKPIQLVGFAILTILFIAIGFGFHQLKHTHNGLLGLYVVAQFFFNFGPNATTFIVPGECFPTRYRSTSHGISAAAGKIGAIIAQCVFGPLAHRGATKTDDSPWLNHVMEIFSLFMLCGFLSTWLIPETKRKSLEVLSGENGPTVVVQTPRTAVPVKDEVDATTVATTTAPASAEAHV
ncbi:hypothetical protein MYU51_007463 [Penicillium brevicompactum]